ncbi:MAG TPA: PP2C family protein-serine/threonine phosphatase [Thermoanaerobaculia bacterium]|jgi:serine phosphatase RsbU (regulator of sigma subunit)
MARLRDWFNLGKSTFSSITSNDVANFYSLEWPETKEKLLADHRFEIDRTRSRFKRWILSVSAVMYGLAKRLAPHRRVLFVVSMAAFFTCLFAIFTRMDDPPVWTFVEVAATFLMMTLLLAMELLDKLKYRDELALARDLQASLIPRHTPQTTTYDTAAFNHIANTVGGDIYDFVPLPDGRLAVLFGDASGHGMAAGLVMAVAHAAFRTQLDVDPSPRGIVGSLNRILCRTGGPRSFFSCCYVLLSPDGEFTATVAGHPQILKVGADGKVVDRIGRGAYPLGVKSGIEWETAAGNLAHGERLVLYSDGLPESRNRDDREFGDAYVEAIAGWKPEASSESLVQMLVAEWRLFTSGKPAEDDVSIAVIRRV